MKLKTVGLKDINDKGLASQELIYVAFEENGTVEADENGVFFIPIEGRQDCLKICLYKRNNFICCIRS